MSKIFYDTILLMFLLLIFTTAIVGAASMQFEFEEGKKRNDYFGFDPQVMPGAGNLCADQQHTDNGMSRLSQRIATYLYTAAPRPHMSRLVNGQLDFALTQYQRMAQSLPAGRLPRSGRQNGSLWTAGPEQWTCGFYPGTLWYLYEHSGANWTQQEATNRMWLLSREQFNTGTHDVGFKMYTSFGHAYALRMKRNDNVTVAERVRQVLLQTATSLATRFNSAVGCIRSWNSGRWQFPVIIDNMMNLELLCWAAKASGNCTLMRMAESHANRTIKDHFRSDYSSVHLVDYNRTSGAVIGNQTWQGYSDNSSWARGQAWGLYGFTMMFRETGRQKYLAQARQIARYMLNSPKVPADGIPFWDYDVSKVNNTDLRKRDASAAAITASALLELGFHVSSRPSAIPEAFRYWTSAVRILSTLSRAPNGYRAELGKSANFLLNHSVGNFPSSTEVDVSIVYADYYFVEALTRYKRLFGL